MDHANWVTEQFEASRPRLRAVAYRMLGSHAEADDAVQEAWLRLARDDRSDVENLGGWLTTVVSRVCLDRLRSRKSRREDPAGAQPPEPDPWADRDNDPEHQALTADSVGAALLVVLDLLAPVERVAFVLHDVFAVPFDEIAEIVGRSPEATRQLASRARRRVQGTAGAPEVDLVRQREVVGARSLRRHAAVTSRVCCRCSTPTSCCAPTRPHCGWARCPRPKGPPKSQPRCPVAHEWHGSR
jgi:RNA polymerase sigma factor (sigma-70 family)